MTSRAGSVARLAVLLWVLLGSAGASPQGDAGPEPNQPLAQDSLAGLSQQYACPEKNGLFRDEEQCDLYYECSGSKAVAKLCPDGMLFDDRIRNHEKCVLPHNVDCGKREFVQPRQEGIDERCDRANGLFDHDDPAVCDRFLTCDNGTAHEIPCPTQLMFDVAIGACVRPEQASNEAKRCGGDGDPSGADSSNSRLKTVEGFTCPGKETVGPQGLLQAHPSFPHPTDCRYFFTCYFGTEPNKLGCSEGQVFDAASVICKNPAEVKECRCWYECDEKSACPDACNGDCSCPSDLPNSPPGRNVDEEATDLEDDDPSS